MEAQKPNVATKPAKVADNKKSNVPGIKNAIWMLDWFDDCRYAI